MENDDRLLEPISAFDTYYEKAFLDNTTAYFDELVAKSGIDIALNQKTVREYNTELTHAQNEARTVASQKSLRTLCIFLCVAGFIAAVIGIATLVMTDNVLGGVLMLVIGAVVGVGMIPLVKFVITPKIKAAEKRRDEKRAKADALCQTAWTQMRPLNELYESTITKTLIEKTVPLLKIDDNFDMKRYDYLSGKYGFGENDDETRSTIALVSGEILGNPFVVDRELVREIGSETYTGWLDISWTTSYTDSQGVRHTQHHTQRLTATVKKPKPYYSEQTRLIYGNDAAPDLVFSHEPTHAERWSEKELERNVKSGAREIRSMQKNRLKSGGATFTEMGNSEFDVLFNAIDRNNEVQFRLLFTPLAQKNMLALMKDSKHYGDDFYFLKRNCLNFISSEHSADWDLDTNYRRYMSFDIDAARREFIGFNTEYFKKMFFEFAPLLSIPLYQQHKPQEYIYKELYDRNYTDYEAECAVNRMGEAAFPCADSTTRSILKTHLLAKDGGSDSIAVTAHAYRTEQRVDYVSMLGGDGNLHSVPVYWDEYIPIRSDSVVKLKQLGLSDREYERGLDGEFGTALDAFKNRSYDRGLLCCKIADAEVDAPFDERLGALLDGVKKLSRSAAALNKVK